MLIQERLKELLQYNPETGEFVWKVDAFRHKNKGKKAGCLTPDGYLSIGVKGKKYLAHRLAWFYETGEWPKEHIDHKDGVRNNNKWSNLREASREINNQNLKTAKRSNKNTGLLGAYKDRTRYRAAITINGKEKHIGCFGTAEEAHQAYLEMKRKYHEGCTV